MPRSTSMWSTRRIERWQSLEGSCCQAANRWGGRRWVRPCMTAVSRAGDGPAWYALMLALIAFDGLRGLAASLHMASTGLAALLVYLAIKRVTRRARPFDAMPGIHAWTPALDRYSFPSGHTLHALAFTLVALAWYPQLGWILLPFCALVAVSRVVLGLHYPTDVLASVVLACGVGRASLATFAAG